MSDPILRMGDVPSANEKRSRILGGTLALVAGLGLVISNMFGAPLPFPNGGVMPDHVGIPAGLLFVAGGLVLLIRKNYTEINREKGIVIAWHSAWDRRRVNRPLKAMERTFMHPIPSDHDADVLVYEVGLAWGESSVTLCVEDSEEKGQASLATLKQFTGLNEGTDGP